MTGFAVIGLDLALRRTGFAVLDWEGARVTSGVWVTKPAGGLGERLNELCGHVTAIVDEGDVDSVWIEWPLTYAGHGATSVKLGMVHGAVHLVLWNRRRILPRDVHASTLKKHATGKGNATKLEVTQAAVERWGFGMAHDEADALSAASYGLEQRRLETAVVS